ncbi:MAG: ATP-binding protein, partial [Acidimicrobiales bacterium]
VYDHPDDPVIVGLRGAGVVALALGSVGWRAGRGARWLFHGGLAALAGAIGAALAGYEHQSVFPLGAGALLIGAALLLASSRSIPARIAASAAANLLLVVLVVSIGLSAVLSSSVENEGRRRIADRARTEAARLREAAERARDGAGIIASALQSNRPELLAGLASNPAPSPALAGDLGNLSNIFLDDGPLAYISASGRILASVGLEESEFIPIVGSRAVQEALSAVDQRESVEVVGGRALAVGVVALELQRPQRLAGAVIGARLLDGAYLAVRAQDDPSLSLALMSRTAIVAGAGEAPPGAARSLVGRVLASGQGETTVVSGSILAASPVGLAGANPVLAMVASTPTTVLDDTRASLFQTLFVIALGGSILAVLLAALVGDRIGAGLRRLTTAAEAIRRGESGVRAGVSSQDEVGVLSAAFDKMMGSIEDTTSALQRAAEDEARLRNRLEAVVAGMGEALIAVDGAGRITDFNRAAEHLLGSGAAEAVGVAAATVVRLRADDGTDLAPRLAAGGRPWSATAIVRGARGADIPVAVSVGYLGGARATGTVLVMRDLRRERQVEQMKTEFLSRVGHELRTPLAPIIGYSQILASRDLPPAKVRELNSSIHQSALRLSRQVRMLEFFASAQAGRSDLRPERVVVRDLLESVVTAWQAKLNGSHTLRRRVARSLPDVSADPRWLAASLDELIDNAVKFSPSGSRISISAEPARSRGRTGVSIMVTDPGIGMTGEQIDRAFGEFTQADESDTRSYGGLGLGLALVKRVIEGHGGRVDCASEPDHGSTLSIFLPGLPTSSEDDDDDQIPGSGAGGGGAPRGGMRG